MSLNLPFGIQPVNAMSNNDERYGPHTSIANALAATAGTRKEGLTVGVIEGGKVVEYWFESDIGDGDLVVKTAEGGAQAFTGLTDTPSNYVNTNYIRSTTNSLEYRTPAQVRSDISAAPSSHVGDTGAAHGVATTSVAGFMGSGDKTKLDGIAANADNYSSWSLCAVGITGTQTIGSGAVACIAGGTDLTVARAAGLITLNHGSSGWTNKTTLTGANVISNLTINAQGHVSNWTTRALTASDVGADNYSSWIVGDAGPNVFGDVRSGNVVFFNGGTGIELPLVTDNVGIYTISYSVDGTVFRNAIDSVYTNFADRNICFNANTISGGAGRTLTICGNNYVVSAGGRGGDICIESGCKGDAGGVSCGGNLSMKAGYVLTTSTWTGCGGNVELIGGCSCNTSTGFKRGGLITIKGGDALCGTGVLCGGSLDIFGGDAISNTSTATCRDGGGVSICGGSPLGSGAASITRGGTICINGGNAGVGSSRLGGNVFITSGSGTVSGSINISVPHSAGNAGGNINITSGSANGSGGSLSLGAGDGGSSPGLVRIYHGFGNEVLNTTNTGVRLIGTQILLDTETNTTVDYDGINTSLTAARILSICGQTTNRTLSGRSGDINIVSGCYIGGGVDANNYCGGNLQLDGGCVNLGSSSGIARGGCLTIWAGNANSSSSIGSRFGGNLILRGGCALGSGTRVGGNIIMCAGGTTSPGTGGDICIASGFGGTHGDVNLFVTTSLRFKGCSDGCAILYNNGTVRLWTTTNGIQVSTIGCATDWVASSDCRVKKDITPISNALSMINKLCGVCYKMCDDELNESRVGLIAQDVLPVIPEIVSHGEPNKDDEKYGITDGKYGLKYDKLTAVLVEAIKEQQKQINELKNQIMELKNK